MAESKHFRFAGFIATAIILFPFLNEYFLNDYFPLFTTNIFVRLVGIVLLIIFSGYLGFNLKKFCFKSYGWHYEMLYGAAFSIVPIVLVYLFKFIYFDFRGYENLTLTFRPSGIEAFTGSSEYYINTAVYILTLFIVAVFKEIFYRGYLITQFSSKLGVPLAVFIQSLIYMVSFLPSLIHNLNSDSFAEQGIVMNLLLLSGYLVYNLICGVKWGLYYRVNGTVWMSVTDHFLTDFITASFFYTEERLPEKWVIAELIVIQLISVIMFIPFFVKRDKQNEIAAAEFALSVETLKMGVDDYSPSILRKRSNKKYNSQTEEDLIERYNETEEPVSSNDISMPDENSLTSSLKRYDLTDSGFNYNTEVSDFESNPKEKTKEYFNDLLGREEGAKQQDKVDSSNAENISALSIKVCKFLKIK